MEAPPPPPPPPYIIFRTPLRYSCASSSCASAPRDAIANASVGRARSASGVAGVGAAPLPPPFPFPAGVGVATPRFRLASSTTKDARKPRSASFSASRTLCVNASVTATVFAAPSSSFSSSLSLAANFAMTFVTTGGVFISIRRVAFPAAATASNGDASSSHAASSSASSRRCAGVSGTTEGFVSSMTYRRRSALSFGAANDIAFVLFGVRAWCVSLRARRRLDARPSDDNFESKKHIARFSNHCPRSSPPINLTPGAGGADRYLKARARAPSWRAIGQQTFPGRVALARGQIETPAAHAARARASPAGSRDSGVDVAVG